MVPRLRGDVSKLGFEVSTWRGYGGWASEILHHQVGMVKNIEKPNQPIFWGDFAPSTGDFAPTVTGFVTS